MDLLMNDAERHLMTIFSAALDRGSEAERAAYLAEACGADPALRERVEALLRAHEQAGGFLEPRGTAAFEPSSAANATPDAMAGTVIAGRYKLVEEIGEGGMGTVWMGQQTEPVKRAVAVKLIKRGMDSKQVLARFEAERQALALMDHPNIAKVLDGGMTGEPGRPFFVMELVKGAPITKYCDEHRLTPRQRLELFVPVCQAVQHAHQKGIIHRDIKPSNILVAQYDGRPVPKVIDFGVAKAAGQQLTDKTLMTGFGAVVGTLEYMSPEQAELNQLDIDTRSDIYSLGVVLYELLTGSTPLDRKRFKQAAFAEILRVIREEEPQKPSTRLSNSTDSLPSVSAQRQMEPAKLTKLVRGELDWIVMKALDKDRNRRYETANGFSMDIQRYLADEPVQACPPSTGYRLRKFLRRNKRPVLAVGIIALLLVAGVAGTTTGLFRAIAAEKRTAKERDQKEQAWRQTQQALNTLTDEVVQDLLERQVELTDQHRDFLRKILGYHEAFAAAKADGTEGRQSRAEGSFRVGRIRFMLGEFKDSETGYRDAESLYQGLAAEAPDEPLFRANQTACLHNLGILLRDTGRTKEAERALRDGLALQQQLVDRFPDRSEFKEVLVLSEVNLGILLSDNGAAEEAERHYRVALELAKSLMAEFPGRPENRERAAFAYNNLAMLWADLGRKEAAEDAYREALAIRKKLVEEFPKRGEFRSGLAMSYNNLGALMRATDRLEEAESCYRESLAIRKKLAAEFPNRPQYRAELVQGYLNLGNALGARGLVTEAVASYRDGLAVGTLLVAEFSEHPENRLILAQTYAALGDLIRRSRPQEGQSALEEAIGILKKLAADFPKRPDFRFDLAKAEEELGIHWLINNRPKESETALQDALGILKQLAQDFPERPNYRKVLAGTHWSLGNLKAAAKQPKEAEAAFLEAIALQKQLVSAYPKRTDFISDLLESQNNFGGLLHSVDRTKEAEELWQNALAVRKKLAADYPKVPLYQNDVAGSLVNLATLYSERKEFAVSVKLLQEAQPYHLAALKGNANNHTFREFYHNNLTALVRCYRALARHDELGKSVEELVRFGFDVPNDFYDAAAYLCHCAAMAAYDAQLEQAKRKELANTYADRALAMLQKAIELGYRDPARFPDHPQYRRDLGLCHVQVANTLNDINRPNDAEALYREAQSIQEQLAADFPKVPDYQNDLAGTLVNWAILHKQRRKFDAAMALLEKAQPHHLAALKANPKQGIYRQYYRNNLWVLSECLVGLADHARLATVADELARFNFDPVKDTYNAAGFLSRCVALAEKDKSIDEAKRKELGDQYAKGALALLRQAVARGFKDAARLKQGPEFEALQMREEFKMLLAELEKKNNK
jgi:serine/threonine protein kinase/tetratricopeptide (TPR) repeat protein